MNKPKLIMACLLTLIGISDPVYAQLTRNQISDQKELRTMSLDILRMGKDEEERIEAIAIDKKIGFSTEYNEGGGTTLTVPFSTTIKRNDKASFALSSSYKKEFNNGNNNKVGLDDVNFKFSSSNAFGHTGLSYNLGVSAPMNSVSRGMAIQSMAISYKHKIPEQKLSLQPLVKITHYNGAQSDEASLSKSLTAKLSLEDSGLAASLARKIRSGTAGLTQFNLDYQFKLDQYSSNNIWRNISCSLGYLRRLTEASGNSFSVELTKSF